ncbi:MAG TPA: ergothioneine biosynthesis protein EgtB [Verrucomicrobiae bacterium]|nr:ergothioneine biosynthesis protein EgtB [Verrucomicrobiae bacterium]
MTTEQQNSSEIPNQLEQFKKIRGLTLELVRNLEKEDFVVQTAAFTSPPKWHLGHVSWFYEVIMSKLDQHYEFYSQEYSKYLNSYYQSLGQPHEKAKRGILSRPTVEETLQYFNIINERVELFLKKSQPSDNLIYLFKTAFNHECQHQELLVYDIQHLLGSAYRPVKHKSHPRHLPSLELRTVSIPGGLYDMGYSGTDFSYDIELPEHKVYLNNYTIDVFPVTNQEYLKFVQDGGYEEFRFWLADGWEIVKKNEWKAPMYWENEDGIWLKNDFRGKEKLNPNEPIYNISYYEADAYCKWAGKRLPTEAEWEKAASWNENKKLKTIYPWGNDAPTENHANLLESYLWSPAEIGSYPLGKSYYGLHQMMGDVWEWTSSDFIGYPGFKSGFTEYNDKWFVNQKVLRGSSFATPKYSIRNSYRNFFRPEERWMFSGFRCVQDT